ncbi:hypothetical protein CDD81_2790 [Ophiocordyceps australis]|uniref:ubiquitinyl hydrolase 1 n=1 Tax=Ophiocordyceps australis TaxID=1399860 RepID=A0A2C5XXE5_9HYPO|nr:hypothetical protein CDD81_2790 [Ophiocordyceps australis]
MFQPQPTPFVSSSCYASPLSSNGIGFALGFGIPPPPPSTRGQGPSAATCSTGSNFEPGARPSSSSFAPLVPQQQPSPGFGQLPIPTLPSRYHHLPQSHKLAPSSRLHNFPLNHCAMDDAQGHDMAAQQDAARDYQPVLEGPMVDEKTPSDAITKEYAKADPVYVEKTLALPQTYSFYRRIKGDGNCGWRAIGYSYCEKLVESGDQAKVEGEVARLMSYNRMLASVGGYPYYEDWADEMLGLLRDMASSMNDLDTARNIVNQRWNDSSVESSLIYYLRLLAATFLKSNDATYDPFVPDGQGVATYCSQCIELPSREIEHLGIVALVNILLKPADLVLEIAYLDRSRGSQVNHHRFNDEGQVQGNHDANSIIYLLYRPDHYDILYRTPRISLSVNRVTGISDSAQITGISSLSSFSNGNFSMLSMIPGFENIAGMSSLSLPPRNDGPVATAPMSPEPHHSPWPSHLPDAMRLPGSQSNAHQAVIAACPRVPAPMSPLTVGSSALDSQSRSGIIEASGAVSTAGCPIRFSQVQLEYEGCKNTQEFQVKTNTFKNSVWNRAHYGNPDFHPEEWSPEEDHVDGRVSKKRGRKD